MILKQWNEGQGEGKSEKKNINKATRKIKKEGLTKLQ